MKSATLREIIIKGVQTQWNELAKLTMETIMSCVTLSALNTDNTGKHAARAFAAEARHRFHTC